MIGVEVDVGVDGDHFGLRETFVALEVALVASLNFPLLLGGEVFVEDVRVVIKP